MEFLKRLTSPCIRPQVSVEEQIEQSKSHWSQVVMSDTITDEEEVAENLREFQRLQSHPTWGDFFQTFDYDIGDCLSSGLLEIGEKFAEGGQAELFHAKVVWRIPRFNEMDLSHGREWVLKVFKKGTLLRHLQSQWPQGMLQHHVDRKERTSRGVVQDLQRTCDVAYGILLKDGRFAFLMIREREDLRSLIDRRMISNRNQDSGPFVQDDVEYIMHRIAQGVEWLHNRNIVHRDLKTSNVLCSRSVDNYVVADFECSIGVIGTGFWRAPEILQACKDRVVSSKPHLFTKAADIYSYGMICYEVLTGKHPFQGGRVTIDDVLNGRRPDVPKYVENWKLELLCRCWQSEPTARPSIGEVLKLLVAKSRIARVIDEVEKEWKLNPTHFPLEYSFEYIQ